MPAAGLTLHTSNRLELLADDLALVLAAPLRSPFTPELVVVQSNGMRRWLEQQLAQRQGICANVRFPFPQEFFLERFAGGFPEATATNLFAREIMTWRIMQLLPRFAGDAQFAPVARYLRGERSELRAYELSRQIAHVFDQYLVFRPEMILRWDQGEGDGWQQTLWRALQEAAPGQHQAALGSKLRAALAAGAQVPERVCVFGISTLPPFYVSLIEEMATRCPVHLFLMEPTPHWFGDIRSKREHLRNAQRELDFNGSERQDNPLLAANARLSRDFLNAVADLTPREFREQFEAPARDTLLHQIQRDIYDLENSTETDALAAIDSSVQVHSCHSVVRELEVLQDQLLALFERDPELKPRDVVVTMPNVSDYASFIDAVFGVPEKPEHRIPFSIADRAPRASSGVIDTFFRILETLPGRFGASEVLAVLESPAVQRRFHLTDLALLTRWIERCGVRWGIDGHHRARLGFPEFAENSWRAGIDRMLLGCALQPHGRDLFEGILPFDEIEGSNAILLGNFVEFLERLFARADEFAKPRLLAVWQRDLLAMVDDFLDPDESGQLELIQLRSAVNHLGEISVALEKDAAVALDVVAAQLENSLEQNASGRGFLAGRVTFCALKPMRSIPFKVVCLLGMNDGAYPRHQRAPSFDLLAAQPRRGDRNARDDDRALFLEALLSARDVFYLSYVGQSIRDNSTLPPSVLVGELLEYIANATNFGELTITHARQETARQPLPVPGQENNRDFTIAHPLQAFSARNFFENERLFSYSAENCRAAELTRVAPTEERSLFEQPLSEPGAEWREVEIAQMIKFFAAPAEFILRQRLNIDLPSDEEETEDREPFALHSLARYEIEQDFLDSALAGAPFHAELNGIRAAGVLPQGAAGALVFDELCGSVRAFASAIGEHVAVEEREPLLVSAQIGQFNLRGAIKRIRGDTLVHYRLTRLKPKDYLRLWIEHLARNLCEPQPALLFGKERDAVTGYSFAPVENAHGRLADLLELYWEGLRQPLPLFPRTSWAFAEAFAEKRDEAAARKAASAIWRGKEDEEGGERYGRYIALAFRNVRDPLDDDWVKVSARVFLPIIEARQRLAK